MEKITLFYEDRPDIKISRELYFNREDQLYFDGYDIDKTVDNAWGDADYEYKNRIEPAEVAKFYPLFGLTVGDRQELVNELKRRFGSNSAYSRWGFYE